VKIRSLRLTYPYAFLATVLIVGGAPPASSGLTGCAAPPARTPASDVGANAASLALVASASASASAPPLAPATSAVPIASALPLAPVVAPPALAVVEPAPPPAAPPHVWKAGELQRALSQLGQWAKKNGGELSAELDDVASGAVLGSVAADAPENPASNQKILTTAAVLHHFGASFRFKTSICGARAGDAVARLVLRGSGDPSLSSEHLRALAKTLAQAGLRHVGDVLLDQSFFDGQFVPPAFEQQPQEWAAFRAPVSAASLDRNVVTLNVAPTELGQAARVWFQPEGFVDVTGTVRTEKIERAQNVKLTLKGSGTRLAALVAGAIQPGSPAFHWARRAEDPTLLAGYGLKAALLAEGIQVSGKIGVGGETEQQALATHESQPLSEILPELGKDSDNFYAETLLKDLGAKLKGTPGTSANGASVVLEYLREIEALDAGTRITNGSGLFDANRVSARTLVKTLLHAYRDPAMSDVFVAQLAVGGVDGTLKHRFAAFKKQRSIHAKTGTLDRVIALSGYAFRPDGSSPVAFSLIVSGITNHAEARKRIDDVVVRVARTLAHDAI
jgi:D-alanyl-D-alanine carboxypeptidase/D-alanyl-D-alanine-endopeptidase (penicillin-binding protein 4)